ncbi:hypothetical protein PCE1_004142 [Barthelona sp. PCE]
MESIVSNNEQTTPGIPTVSANNCQVEVLYSAGGMPQSLLLSFDNITLMLDCGWTYDFSTQCFGNDDFNQKISKVDAVLITEGSFQRCGALPYLVQTFLGDQVPVYMTEIARDFALLHIKDTFLNHRLSQDINLLSLSDVDKVFMHQVRPFVFLSDIRISNLMGDELLRVVARRSGTLVGSCYYLISRLNSRTATGELENDILYSSELNIRSSSFLESLDLPRNVTPRYLITLMRVPPVVTKTGRLCLDRDAKNKPIRKILLTSKARRHTLQQTLRKLLKRAKNNTVDPGNILIPTSTYGVSMEVILALESVYEARKEKRGVVYPWKVFYVSPLARNILSLAQRCTNWYGKPVTTALFNNLETSVGTKSLNPFDLDHITLEMDFENVLNYTGPKIIIGGDKDLSSTPARWIFESVARSRNNQILLVEQPNSNSLSEYLLQTLYTSKTVQTQVRKKVVLGDREAVEVREEVARMETVDIEKDDETTTKLMKRIETCCIDRFDSSTFSRLPPPKLQALDWTGFDFDHNIIGCLEPKTEEYEDISVFDESIEEKTVFQYTSRTEDILVRCKIGCIPFDAAFTCEDLIHLVKAASVRNTIVYGPTPAVNQVVSVGRKAGITALKPGTPHQLVLPLEVIPSHMSSESSKALHMEDIGGSVEIASAFAGLSIDPMTREEVLEKKDRIAPRSLSLLPHQYKPLPLLAQTLKGAGYNVIGPFNGTITVNGCVMIKKKKNTFTLSGLLNREYSLIINEIRNIVLRA